MLKESGEPSEPCLPMPCVSQTAPGHPPPQAPQQNCSTRADQKRGEITHMSSPTGQRKTNSSLVLKETSASTGQEASLSASPMLTQHLEPAPRNGD